MFTEAWVKIFHSIILSFTADYRSYELKVIGYWGNITIPVSIDGFSQWVKLL
jgi:hypothetical protein